MPFQKGNTFGIKGRTPSRKTQLKRFEERHPKAYDQLMEVLFSSGLDGHSLDAQYVIDRIKGKPKATIGIDEADANLLKAATVVQFFQMMDRHKLGEGLMDKGRENAIQITGATEGSQ